MVPDTRARISADSTASMRPEKSCCSTTARETTAATLTGGAGGGPPAAAAACASPREQPDRDSRAADTSVSASVDTIRGVGRRVMGFFLDRIGDAHREYPMLRCTMRMY